MLIKIEQLVFLVFGIVLVVFIGCACYNKYCKK